MDRLLVIRSAIHDHFDASPIRQDHFLQPGRRDRFAQYETAMLLLQDTGEALGTHRRREFSQSATLAYIEFWGVVQAIVIQQDAIVELAASVDAPKIGGGVAWDHIRDFRNLLVGHPANKASGRKGGKAKGPMRAFMGRQPKAYRALTYEVWDGHHETIKHPEEDLGGMIDCYEAEAADHLPISSITCVKLGPRPSPMHPRQYAAPGPLAVVGGAIGQGLSRRPATAPCG